MLPESIHGPRSCNLPFHLPFYTQEQLANKVGKSRSHVANIIRLLKLDDDILESVDKGLLSMGHVKVLITIDDKKRQHQIVDQIISQNLNVRQTEELASSAKGKSTIKVNNVVPMKLLRAHAINALKQLLEKNLVFKLL